MNREPRRPAAPGDTTAAARPTRPELLHRELVRRIIRGGHVVHDELGVGFLESVYEGALAAVLVEWGLHVRRQHPLDIAFRGQLLGTFRTDLLVEERVLVELKVARRLLPIHDAQVLNYLRGSGLRVGLLLNFAPRLEYRRLVR